ncbi:hypothetical protein CspeluHIS016_0504150 [Cutaneotrichosporon spelunceum]|uniref:Uncharacterized protein n=1 Tax=Cutaneotrichosporon spelunceum TaxID=1672016 RepID=A0AAD3TX66_9TREE|nr:hypothetical protein CspeluHIS016_0504150 [Cutaneotrichosporon spelunceum]
MLTYIPYTMGDFDHCLLASDGAQFHVRRRHLLEWSPSWPLKRTTTPLDYPAGTVHAALSLIESYAFPPLSADAESLRALALLARMTRELALEPATRRLAKHVAERLRNDSIHGLPAIIIATHLRNAELVVMCIQRGGVMYWAPPVVGAAVLALFPRWAVCALSDAYAEAVVDGYGRGGELDLESAEEAFRDCFARWTAHGEFEEGPVGSIGVPDRVP